MSLKPTLWAELKRGKVFRGMVVDAATAFVILQMATLRHRSARYPVSQSGFRGRLVIK